ncbi:HEAT repeat domain-containing protein, partial [Candidatus Methylomirabilis sp.]|uniref:HEAT repeat domain-containing protein n=1 Tax=Candidatus Methylomirabilis sp. TaxID=2032687 RepID=UPI003C709EB9
EQGKVTVNLAGASLEAVLNAISAQSGIRLVLHGSRPDTISVAFQAVPLEEALRRLIQANFLLVYGPDGTLAEVRVLRAPDESTLAEARETPESLIEQLEGAEPAQRRRVVLALGESRDAQAVEPLVKALEEDDAPEVRQAAVSVLEKVQGPQAVAALADAVSKDSDQAVRLSAVKALAKRGGPEAVDALTQALQADAEPSVRHEALVSLAEWGDDQVSDALQQALDDPEAFIRDKAAELLHRRSTAGREP